ncbi:hypothetical protein ABPG75_001562 [Micractinium tetrahymenae]
MQEQAGQCGWPCGTAMENLQDPQRRGRQMAAGSHGTQRALSAPAPSNPAHAQHALLPDDHILQARMQAQQAQLQQQRAEQEEWVAAAQALLAQQWLGQGGSGGSGRPSPPRSLHSSERAQPAHSQNSSGQEQTSQPHNSPLPLRLSGGSTPPRLSDAHAPLRLSDGCTPAGGQHPPARFGHVHSLPLPGHASRAQEQQRFLSEHSLPLLPLTGDGRSPPRSTNGRARQPAGGSPQVPGQHLHDSSGLGATLRPPAVPPQSPPECSSAVKPWSTPPAARPPLAPKRAGSAELLALNRLIVGLQAEIAALEAAEVQRQAQLAREAAKQREWERKKRQWEAEQAREAEAPRRKLPTSLAAPEQPAAGSWPTAAAAAAEGALAAAPPAQKQLQGWEQRRARELAAWERRHERARNARQRQQAQQAALAEEEQRQRESEEALQRAWQQHLLAAGPAQPAAFDAAAAGLAGAFNVFEHARLSAPARMQAAPAGEAGWASPEASLESMLQAPPEQQSRTESMNIERTLPLSTLDLMGAAQELELGMDDDAQAEASQVMGSPGRGGPLPAPAPPAPPALLPVPDQLRTQPLPPGALHERWGIPAEEVLVRQGR